MRLKPILLLFALSVLVCPYAPVLTEEIADQILKQNKIYFLHVGFNTTPRLWKIFGQACLQGFPCAVVNKSSRFFRTIQQTFSYLKKREYFAIFDVEKQKKYILPARCDITTDELKSFFKEFKEGKLQPYEASEEPAQNPFPYCKKVVASNLDGFLNSETPLKVLFLRGGEYMCEDCKKIEQFFCEYGKKMYDPKLIDFGHYDVYKNDSPLIETERMPYFYIYCPGYPLFGISGRKSEYLHNTLMDVILRFTETGTTEDTIILQSTNLPSMSAYEVNIVNNEGEIINGGQNELYSEQMWSNWDWQEEFSDEL